MTESSHHLGSHAIVIGGGMAGLLAARVLANHFERITLIERDHYPAEPIFRPGIPQGRHVHVLLTKGQQVIEALFPGIKAKLVARGAVEVDFNNDCIYRGLGGWARSSPSRLKGYSLTRPLLEWQVYQELVQRYPVETIEQHEVVSLLADEGSQRVTGVRIRARGNPASAENALTELSADLVVDASGRDSPVSRWLEELGYTSPAETVINAFFGYASRIYLPSPDPDRSWKGVAINFTPPSNLRGGVIWPIEEQKWVVLLAGAGKDYPPTDEDAFIEFAKTLPDDGLLYNAIKDAQPLSSIYGYRRTENRLRHFEQLARQPERFIVLGDAVCAFNPIYGQGMSVAALSAVTLDEMLRQREGLTGFSRRFQQRLAKVHELPWQLAASSDFRVPGTTGVEGRKTDRMSRLTQQYIERVMAIAPKSTLASRVFLEVLHMMSPPIALFHPAIMMAVLAERRRP